MDATGPIRAAAAHARSAAARQPHADVAIAGIVLAVTLLTTAGAPRVRPLDASAVLTAVATAAVLVLRRRYPFAVLAVSTVGAETFLFLFRGDGGALVVAAPLIALYTVADLSTRRRGVIIAVLAVLVVGGFHAAVKPASWLGAENIALAALGALAVAAGTAARNRRAYLTEVEARARDAEADRDTEAARRVTEERLRIARDLHDLLGHHLTVIHVQAEVAAHVLVDPPRRADEALTHIRAASKSALSELGDTVGLLRRPDEPAAPTQPTAGLAGLADLLVTFRRAGLEITEHSDGDARLIPVSTDLVAYRIIQESLTNVCKHAGPTIVDLRLTYLPETLRLSIDNRPGPMRPARAEADPLTPVSLTGGHGLLGMRERVQALGGTLRAGPRPEGGYRVSASLPLPARAAATGGTPPSAPSGVPNPKETA